MTMPRNTHPSRDERAGSGITAAETAAFVGALLLVVVLIALL